MSNNTNDYKPCPFCGATWNPKAVVLSEFPYHGRVSYYISYDCQCGIGLDCACSTEESARNLLKSLWNTRAYEGNKTLTP